MRLSHIITDLHEQANPSDAEFWKTVKNARWTSDHNYDRIKYQWMRTLTQPQSEGLRRKFDKIRARLNNKITNIVYHVSDDGFSDLVAHIIGMGKDTYDAVMQNPRLAQNIIDANEYVENFGYSFPDKDDYNLIDPQHLIKQATGYLENLSELTGNRSVISSQEDADTLRDMIKRLRFAESGDFKKAIQINGGWDKVLYNRWGKLARHVERTGWFDAMYGPPNLLNDLKDFLKR